MTSGPEPATAPPGEEEKLDETDEARAQRSSMGMVRASDAFFSPLRLVWDVLLLVLKHPVDRWQARPLLYVPASTPRS